MKPYLSLLITATILALFLAPSPASAQVAPPLGTAQNYTVLGTNPIATSGTVTCTGPGTINGNVGTTFNSITNTGTPPCTINGSIDAPVAADVVASFNTAKTAIDALNPVCTGTIPTTTTTLTPGVYCSAAATSIGIGVTITLSGGANDVWIFRVGTGGLGALTLTDANVVMGGAAQACNVYWKTAEAATLTRATFVGTILSGTAITMTDGSWVGRAMASTDVTLTRPAPITGCAAASSNTIVVNKDFIPNSGAPVSVSLACTSGTVAVTPLNASEGAPAVFTVNGAAAGATCTATEVVPPGYTANQLNCVGVALGGSCTITNTLNSATITVNKDFIPDSGAPVSVSLACTSGTVAVTPLNAVEGAPAVFTVNGASAGATCTATEVVPPGYTANQLNCVAVALGGSCTITNTQIAGPAIPTLSEWMMTMLVALFAFLGVAVIRRQL